MKIKHLYIKIVVCVLILAWCSVSAQSTIIHEKLYWKKPSLTYTADSTTIPFWSFTTYQAYGNAIYTNASEQIPYYNIKVALLSQDENPTIEILNRIYETIDDWSLDGIDFSSISDTFIVHQNKQVESKKPFLNIYFEPIRQNPLTGDYERLVAFDLNITHTNTLQRKNDNTLSYAEHSVLHNGTWYKVAVSEKGIYRITYEDLKNMGVDVDNLNPKHISLWGNGGNMLPENNTAQHPDDLVENAIVVSGEEDEHFNTNDYILFYTNGVEQLTRKSGNLFGHLTNFYATQTYYYLCVDNTIGKHKRVAETTCEAEANNTETTYNYHAYLEPELYNQLQTGRIWLGNKFDNTTEQHFTFDIPNLNTTLPVLATISFYSDATQMARLTVATNGQSQSAYLNSTVLTTQTFRFDVSAAPIDLKLTYTKPQNSSVGYLNYIDINATCNLQFSGSQFNFRSLSATSEGKVSAFQITTQQPSVKVWDVTTPTQPTQFATTTTASGIQFVTETETLKEFCVWANEFKSVTPIGRIANQNLHNLSATEIVVITTKALHPAANRLADFHHNYDGRSIAVVDVEDIYNEFSSGTLDPTAIRNFLKMLYDQPNSPLKFLILFGDASYDYRNILNLQSPDILVPNFQNEESFNAGALWSNDDYFGLLDDGEGDNCTGGLDLAIGRIPIQTIEQANTIIDKMIRYTATNDLVGNRKNVVSNLGKWKNIHTVVGDDEDNNQHLIDAETVANRISEVAADSVVIEKVFLDAYKQVSSSNGNRYPDVENALQKRFKEGALTFTYFGHGGNNGLAHERILSTPNMRTMTNTYNMPLVITATCEFCRYDFAGYTAPCETMFLNENGGCAITLSTSRQTYSSSNHNYVMNLLPEFFNRAKTIGELHQIAKNNANADIFKSVRSFVLIGDPALKFPLPKYNVQTLNINGKDPATEADTLRALSQVTVEGRITDHNGNAIPNFSGTLYMTVYDKPTQITTLANDEKSSPYTFYSQHNVLYDGKTEVHNGVFETSFILPKDIAYNYGNGKIVYYAQCDTADANGFCQDIIIGGIDEQSISDATPPEVALYLNDSSFVSGGITDANPMLYAVITDSLGINTSGTGIGHDITAILDNDYSHPIILNNYYTPIDEAGIVTYPLANLSKGKHSLFLRVWNILNLATEVAIEFEVADTNRLVVEKLYAYPNPARTQTSLRFQHNRPNETLKIKVEVFSLSGILQTSMTTTLTPTGYQSELPAWNLTNQNGVPLRKGMYMCKLTVTDSKSNETTQTTKLVISR